MLSPSTVSSIDIALAQCDAARTGIPIAPASFVDNRTAFEAAMKVGHHNRSSLVEFKPKTDGMLAIGIYLAAQLCKDRQTCLQVWNR